MVPENGDKEQRASNLAGRESAPCNLAPPLAALAPASDPGPGSAPPHASAASGSFAPREAEAACCDLGGRPCAASSAPPASSDACGLLCARINRTPAASTCVALATRGIGGRPSLPTKDDDGVLGGVGGSLSKSLCVGVDGSGRCRGDGGGVCCCASSDIGDLSACVVRAVRQCSKCPWPLCSPLLLCPGTATRSFCTCIVDSHSSTFAKLRGRKPASRRRQRYSKTRTPLQRRKKQFSVQTQRFDGSDPHICFVSAGFTPPVQVPFKRPPYASGICSIGRRSLRAAE